ncbi:hypothetical protein ACIBU0_25510 [Streptomyces sp. NPDC049627]|uniref:hypothetical protein n=1 Tax=Streptomyces sp. NPDC049627 TaxID=3365595 RepID=UPI003799DEA7
MSVEQLPARIREFVDYLDGLVARLDQGGGWCGVFWQRDPEGMQACLDGREVPPWDVVESLLHDLAAQYGPGGAGPETERARALHSAALAAYDARPGGRDALGDRLDVMLREQRYAAERQAELGHALASATTQEQADTIRLDLAWARDDHDRATARCAELRARMTDLDRRMAREHGQAIRRDRVGEGASFRLDGRGGSDGFRGERGGGDGFRRDRGAGQGFRRDEVGVEEFRSEPVAERGVRQGRLGGAGAEAVGSEDVGFGVEGVRRDEVGDEGFRGEQVGGDRLRHGRLGGTGAEVVGPQGVGFEGPRPGADRMQPREAGSHGGGFPGVPHQRDEQSEAEATQWRAAGRRDARPEGAAGSYGGGGAAETAEWAGAHGADAGAGRPSGFHRDRPAPAGAAAAFDWPQAEHAAVGHPDDRPTPAGAPADTHPGGHPQAQPADPAPTAKQRKRRRGSARFAGMVEEEAAPVVVPPTAAPTLPAQPATGRRTPRGARFAGATDEAPMSPAEPQAEPMDTADRGEVARTVETIVRLRAEGRSGEAHVLLVEAAYWPALRFPALAAEMERAGLGADWATLLWEAASLPAERLVAAADALTAAGRAGDGEQILRQGVARPANEIGQAVVGLAGEGRHREVRALLDAYVRVRTPEEAARSAAPDPKTLVPLLLEAARGVSDERHWDLVHALRVAGFTA